MGFRSDWKTPFLGLGRFGQMHLLSQGCHHSQPLLTFPFEPLALGNRDDPGGAGQTVSALPCDMTANLEGGRGRRCGNYIAFMRNMSSHRKAALHLDITARSLVPAGARRWDAWLQSHVPFPGTLFSPCQAASDTLPASAHVLLQPLPVFNLLSTEDIDDERRVRWGKHEADYCWRGTSFPLAQASRRNGGDEKQL